MRIDAVNVFPLLLLLLPTWALADKHFESGWFRAGDYGDLVPSIRDPSNRDRLHSSWLGSHRQYSKSAGLGSGQQHAPSLCDS